jgi:hypothetical protein
MVTVFRKEGRKEGRKDNSHTPRKRDQRKSF